MKKNKSIEDVMFNCDSEVCNICNCIICSNFQHKFLDQDEKSVCPFGDPCEECGQKHMPIDCPYWPGTIDNLIERN